jgi:hypothetical protein
MATRTAIIRPRAARGNAKQDFPPRPAVENIRFLERLAYWLDNAFRIPGLGWRFGLDAVLDLIPGIGDALGTLASLVIFQAARRYGVPRIAIVRMALNIGIDFIGGLLPLVGPLFDAYWKANIWNVELLKRHLAATPLEAQRARRSDTLFVIAVMTLLIAFMAGAAALAYVVLAALIKLLFHAG